MTSAPLVSVDIEDWVCEVTGWCFKLLAKHGMHGAAEIIQALPLLAAWLKNTKRDKLVDSPHKFAWMFLTEASFMIRSEEDWFLMNELKTRDEHFTNEEWEEYVRSKGAIFWNLDIAFLDDGSE